MYQKIRLEIMMRPTFLLYYFKDQAPTPWSKILLTPAVWALVIAEVGFDWGSITISNDLPKYMNDVLHFSVKTVSFNSNIYIFFFTKIEVCIYSRFY